MTRLAGVAEAAVVLVITCMARGARLWGRLVSLGGVARFAACLAMPPVQGKGGRVIEAGRGPGGLGVAGVAGLPQAFRVRVLSTMAGVALSCCLPVPLACCVTVGTGDPGMGAPQRGVGEAMIERLTVELHDLCTAPVMLGVAGLALSAAHRGLLPVIATHAAQIGRHVAVTRQTEAVLRRLVQRGVALIALAL